MSDLSPLPCCDMALCQRLLEEQHGHTFVPSLSSLRPKVSRSSRSLRGEERRGRIICCPFSSLSLPFIPSSLPCARSNTSHLLPSHRSACCACLSNTSPQRQRHRSLRGGGAVFAKEHLTNVPTGRTFTQAHLQTHICTCALAYQMMWLAWVTFERF